MGISCWALNAQLWVQGRPKSSIVHQWETRPRTSVDWRNNRERIIADAEPEWQPCDSKMHRNFPSRSNWALRWYNCERAEHFALSLIWMQSGPKISVTSQRLIKMWVCTQGIVKISSSSFSVSIWKLCYATHCGQMLRRKENSLSKFPW